VILEEILMSHDEPDDLVHDLFGEALFPTHPLGRPVLGTERTIEDMQRDDIVGFHAAHYRPQHVVVAVAGDIDHDVVVEQVNRGAVAVEALAPPVRLPPLADVEPRRVVRRDTEQAHLVLGVRTPGALDDDRFALELVNQSLGGGVSSRLFQEIRERRGLAYSVYSYRAAFSDGGALALYAGTSPKNAPEVVRLFNAALDSLAENGLSERELAIAKGQVKGSTLLGLEDTGARMARLGRGRLVQGAVLPLEDLLARIEAVTLDDLARVIGGLVAQPRVLAAIGPFTESAFG
jgi:predicted Zn-dependent peptidase